jgi:AAA+ ATPase superfamily predicted ATPase
MAPSDAPLLHRTRELTELERAWRSGKPELLIATGRRRAGKSFLLTRFLKTHDGFYYQATKATSREQLRALSEAVATRFPDAGLSYGTGFRNWDAFFSLIVDRAGKKPFFLVLDELPYLLEAVRGFSSIVQKQWDDTLQNTKIKLVLSGSYIAVMRRLTAADQPLHGRRTGRLHFAPFNYADAAAFVPHYSSTDRLLTYAIFGGLPGQLAVVDPEHPLAQNVADHMLNPSGRLADEAEHLFDAFLRDAGVHYSITRAIAYGEHRWQKITNRIGKDSASVSRPLDWLQDMEIVAKVIPATDAPPGNPKKSLYRLADPYLAFWYRFVAPVRATGAVDILAPELIWMRHVEPELSDYMGPVFENICRAFVARGAHPRLPFLPTRAGEWWSDDSQHQIDVVALGPDGQVLLGECKWGVVTERDLGLLEQRRDLIARELRGTRHIHLALFAGKPIVDRRLAKRVDAGEVLLFTPEDLLAPSDVGKRP